MARRRRGKKGKGRKSKAFPILLAAPVIPGFFKAWESRGSGAFEMVRQGVGEISGIDIKGESPLNMPKVYKTLGLVIIGLVGHKVAGRSGINRIMKKATLGYLQL